MSGNNIVADTSLIINLFNGTKGIKQLLQNQNLFISIITEIEVLSYPKLTNEQRIIIREFLS